MLRNKFFFQGKLAFKIFKINPNIDYSLFIILYYTIREVNFSSFLKGTVFKIKRNLCNCELKTLSLFVTKENLHILRTRFFQKKTGKLCANAF